MTHGDSRFLKSTSDRRQQSTTPLSISKYLRERELYLEVRSNDQCRLWAEETPNAPLIISFNSRGSLARSQPERVAPRSHDLLLEDEGEALL
mmetsp:Transcript_33204/g.80350  ORF Transcript_33204/g.80350 Transcript_33204/m.80350 type:complete len:92 (-) Transcript_33204:35-310(-)